MFSRGLKNRERREPERIAFNRTTRFPATSSSRFFKPRLNDLDSRNGSQRRDPVSIYMGRHECPHTRIRTHKKECLLVHFAPRSVRRRARRGFLG
jgi:hypothetical protein